MLTKVTEALLDSRYDFVNNKIDLKPLLLRGSRVTITNNEITYIAKVIISLGKRGKN